VVLVEEETEVESQSTSLAEDRLCSICTEPIPPARLKAMPTTSMCVSCVEATGDVPLLKRHDDYIGRQGDDVVSTYYKGPNQYMDLAVKKFMTNTTYGSEPYEERQD